MAAIQRADDVAPIARLTAAMLWSALRDARGDDIHGRHARLWLVTHGPDWLEIMLNTDDPAAVLADLLDGEPWFDRVSLARLDARPRCVAR